MTPKFIKDFTIFFATIDPIGTLVLFVALTQGLPSAERRRIAGRAVLVAGLILLGFIGVGQIVLARMDVAVHSFQIAGALFLFFFGSQLTFGSSESATISAAPGHDMAIYPLALPTIAGPGALVAAVVLTDNDLFPVSVQAFSALALVIVLVLTYIALLAADSIHRMLGPAGAAALTRMMGLVLASLAVELLLQGLRNLGILAAPAASFG